MSFIHNPFWDKTLTIYTKYFDKEAKKTTWYKYKAYNCFFAINNHTQSIKINDFSINNKYVARIPANINYLSYKEWCEREDKEANMSITVGSLVFSADIDASISENQSGNNLLELYKGKSFKVSAVKDNSSFALKHYYIEGE